MATINEIMASKADKYKKKVAGAFVLVEGDKIGSKVMGSDFCVTKKIDGTMQLVFIQDGQIKSVSRGGKVIEKLPVLDEMKRLANEAGITSGVFAAELYVAHCDGHRERVCEVSMLLAGNPPCEGDKLCMAVFDILEIGGEKFEPSHYRDTLAELGRIFGCGDSVRPVEARDAESIFGIEEIYKEWITGEGAEGIVVHSESPIVYKIKPSHTFDAAVLGYTTADNDDTLICNMLYGMKLANGMWQLIGTSGIGLSNQTRQDLYQRLSDTGVNTDYIVTDSRGVAYRMVEPQIVVELSAIDFVTENSVGEPKMNTVLEYDPEKGYIATGSVSGVSIHSLVVEGIREDKKPDGTDVRISQLTDIVEFAPGCDIPLAQLPKSEMLARRLYTKGTGEKKMIHKFIVFKTNKEQSGKFPAYVLHHTDFSCGRKEPLKRDIRVSSSRKQIFTLLDRFIAENIKKGWAEVA